LAPSVEQAPGLRGPPAAPFLLSLRGFYGRPAKLFGVFTQAQPDSVRSIFVLGGFMDFVFVAGGVLLWGVTVLMVWGLRKLERPQGGRS